jgi:GT2 family glycosyltransferase
MLILHADDIAKPNWITVMAGEVRAVSPSTIAISASYDVLSEDRRVTSGDERGLANKTTIEGTRLSVRDTLERGCWFKISSCAIRLSGFRRLRGFRHDLPQLGDWEFVLRALSAGFAIEYVPMCLSVYRQSSHSVSSISFREHRDVKEALQILHHFHHYLPLQSVLIRHAFYLKCLIRRSCRSLLTHDLARLKAACVVGGRVLQSCFQLAISR